MPRLPPAGQASPSSRSLHGAGMEDTKDFHGIPLREGATTKIEDLLECLNWLSKYHDVRDCGWRAAARIRENMKVLAQFSRGTFCLWENGNHDPKWPPCVVGCVGTVPLRTRTYSCQADRSCGSCEKCLLNRSLCQPKYKSNVFKKNHRYPGLGLFSPWRSLQDPF